MANQKITQLIVADTPADTDLVELVQNVAAEPRSRKATIAQLRTGVLKSSATAEQVITTSDAVNNQITYSISLVHDAGVAVASIGAGIRFRTTNSTPAVVDAASVAGVLTTATGGSEVGVCELRVRASGSLQLAASFSSQGVLLGGVTAALPSNSALGFTNGIVVRNNADSVWLDVYRRDASDVSTFGNSTGASRLQGVTAEVYVNGAARLSVASDGSLVVGSSSLVTEFRGGARVAHRTLAADTTLDAQDEVVFVDTSGGSVTLTLPALTAGRVLSIQRTAGANSVVINRAGGDVIRTGGASVNTWTLTDDTRHSLLGQTSGSKWIAEA